jgi:hypothetical protein
MLVLWTDDFDARRKKLRAVITQRKGWDAAGKYKSHTGSHDRNGTHASKIFGETAHISIAPDALHWAESSHGAENCQEQSRVPGGWLFAL